MPPTLFSIFLSSTSSASTARGKLLDDHNKTKPGVKVKTLGTSCRTVSPGKSPFNIGNEEYACVLQVSSFGFNTSLQAVTLPATRNYSVHAYINDNIFLIPALITSPHRNQDDTCFVGMTLAARLSRTGYLLMKLIPGSFNNKLKLLNHEKTTHHVVFNLSLRMR